MLKVLRKSHITLNDFIKSKQVLSLGINPKYLRTVLQFDGSMTKFVMNLSQGSNKPFVKIIEQKEITVSNINSQEQIINSEKDSIVQLLSIFPQLKIKKAPLIQRLIMFNLINDQKPDSPKLLYFARSFWNKQKYNEIMEKNKNNPIGLNLIEQKVEIFRQLNWTGICDFQIAQSESQKNDPKLYKNLISRSYSMINQGQALCELQEYFLPQMFDIFTNK